MAKSPLRSSIDAVSITIKIDGEEIKEEYAVISVQVNRLINQISTAALTIALPKVEPDKTFELSEANTFLPGKEVEISAGYRGKETTIYRGIIVNHKIQGDATGDFLLLSCSDKAAKLTLGRKTTFHKDMTDQAILKKLIADVGVESQIAETAVTHKQLIQYEAIDWDFIITRAEANGLLVYTENGKVFAEQPISEGDAELVLTYGKDVTSFSAEMESRHQLDQVMTAAWEPKSQALLKGNSIEPSLSKQGDHNGTKLKEVLGVGPSTPNTSAYLPKEELTEWAKASLLKSRLSALRGKVETVGVAAPKLNTLVELAGFGKRFDGLALITGVKHLIEEGRWKTSIDFGLPPTWHHERNNVPSPPASALVPPIHGLQTGTVKKIEEDPEKEHRIEVTIPGMAESGNSIWARLSHFYATNGGGSYFLPEVDDEVILGFVNNDPRFPIILGMLYSSKNVPPYTADQANTNKAIVTKNNLKVVFNDTDKIISLETPGGNKCILSDKEKSISLSDTNGNSIELSSTGIKIKSARDISLEATGSINIDANQNIKVKSSSGDTDLEGLNVNAKAQVGFSAHGQAQAKLESAGQTTVKGAMVMIN